MEHKIISLLQELRIKGPLVHNITNLVVMNNTANALLAIGASPIMAHAREEIPEILQIVDSLVINIGTIEVEWAKAQILAASTANALGKPWVLDPVGAGISKLRNETLDELLKLKPTVIRGNASEIMALQGIQESLGKGVDSTQSSASALDAAKAIQKSYGSIVCISGEIDYIVSNSEIVEIANGAPLMTRVTGLGCTSTAMIGAFLGLDCSAMEAAVAGVSMLSLAGELATKEANGPGSLQYLLYDQLHNLSAVDIKDHLKLKHYGI